ncbi:MAG: Holliday junction resolvase RuvX [Planctomycetes bacterium]|nr:Holliday junction resolvase RuvX [Planctomycetota bacterium]MCP4771438.1 Holliday junction resolvase RuvX [Planctomycetota bacterium]MCP4861875.1 Holliday junction resolvase RuvX [Planctomycetota bacterium]
MKRTGLAVCDALGIAAHPLEAIVSPSLAETVGAIVDLVKEREVKRVVVGMPYLPDGREGEQVKNVFVFLDALRAKLPEGVELMHQDERHTTKEARVLLRETGLKGKKAKAKLDSVAATVILRQYLEEHAN